MYMPLPVSHILTSMRIHLIGKAVRQ